MSTSKGAMAPGNEVTFLVATSVSTPSASLQLKKFSISVIALFDKYTDWKLVVVWGITDIDNYPLDLEYKYTDWKQVVVW